MNNNTSEKPTVRVLDDEALRAWRLPMPSAEADKVERGYVMVIAGSREMPGAAVLAGTAALRVGAGKLVIATGMSAAQSVALAVPEARVIGLPETPAGGVAPGAVDTVAEFSERVDAVLIGPGMQDESSVCELVGALLPHLASCELILDAVAMGVVGRPAEGLGGRTRNQTVSGKNPTNDLHASTSARRPDDFIERFARPVILTPHAGEMAHLTGQPKETIVAEPCEAAQEAALRWNAVVTLKGATTFIASPSSTVWRHDGGNAGLAISGSGDTLSGMIAGLVARGASLEQAAAWGVALHARAGERLAAKLGPLGYLAREIVDEVPGLLHSLRPHSRKDSA
jgi:ADP-dependent NAD(P)H-hydrate dehydratase